MNVMVSGIKPIKGSREGNPATSTKSVGAINLYHVDRRLDEVLVPQGPRRTHRQFLFGEGGGWVRC